MPTLVGIRAMGRSTLLTAALITPPALAQAPRAAVGPNVPPAETLQDGDLLWPKKPGQIVRYNSAAGVATDAERQKYEAERAAELSRLAQLASPTPMEKERYQALSTLDYHKFASFYLAGHPVGTVMPFGGIGPVATGHVAIVTLKGGVPWVIEAMIRSGIRELSFVDWIMGRPGEWVWQGRLKEATADQRARVAKFAASQLGKPYEFWNFDLADETGFYCSKLAWLSVFRTTGQSLDGNVDPRRSLWYSPKQMLHSGLIEIVSSPGPY